MVFMTMKIIKQKMIDHLFLNKDNMYWQEEVRIVKRVSSVIMETHEYWENPYNRYSTLSREIRPGFSQEIIPG